MTMSGSKPADATAASSAAAPSRQTSAAGAKTTASSGASNDGRSPKKKKRTAAADASSAPATPLGVVDPGSDVVDGSIENLDGDPCDAMLARVDPSANSDEFAVLQLIRRAGGAFVVYSRAGRTGASGQGRKWEFDGMEAAVDCFKDEFEKKTGLEWADRAKPAQWNKYCFVRQNYAQKRAGYTGALWQYWVDNGVDGKATAWYDYSDDGSRQAERLYQEYMSNANIQDLSQRCLSSGHYTYKVDFVRMIQTNVAHYNRTSRRIRRVDANGGGITGVVAPPGTNHFAGLSASLPVGAIPSAPPAAAVFPPGPNHFAGASAPPRAPPAGLPASAPPHRVPAGLSASAPPAAPISSIGSNLFSGMPSSLRAMVRRAAPTPRSTRSSSITGHALNYTAPRCISAGVPADALVAIPASCNLKECCVICHDSLEERSCVALKACEHVFHTDCIQLAFKSKPQCPVCRVPIGKPQGKAPSGTMAVSISSARCSGFSEDTILISYNLRSGTQLGYHEHPGRRHGGKHATCYLPNNADGRDLLKRLKFAFMHGLSFTVGTSFTTGRADQCTWASVHHKTSPSGGAQAHGYPDPDYFENCNGELDSLRVPSAQDLDDNGSAK